MTSKSKVQSSAAPASAADNGFSLISNEKLHGLYAAMLKCRMLAERSHVLFKQNKVSGKQFAAGREAAAVGVAIDLHPEDTIAPLTGDPIRYVIHSLPLEALFGRLFQPVAPSPGIAARLKVVTEAAVANKINKTQKISVVFSAGDSSPWHEAMSFAGLHSLPMIFVSWNALPLEAPIRGLQTKAKGAGLKTKSCGFPAITVDGNDAVAVYRVAHEAIAHARMGDGPSLIECQSDGSKSADPILNMEGYLAGKGLFTEGFKAEVTDRFRRELDAAIEVAQRQLFKEAFKVAEAR
jgi:TPP-dependent pyruvate/acetoin dehydrogenase alpha subunit